MEYKHQRKVSLLEGEENIFKKVLSRDSSVGCSSRILYYRSNIGEGVPFKWEMQPGTPKEPAKDEAIPPLSPPPAVLSLGLPKPSINVMEDPPSKASVLKSKLMMFWKQIKKSQEVVRTNNNNNNNKENDFGSNVNVISSSCEEYYSSDIGEEYFMASSSPRNSSSSSSSNYSSLSFCNNNNNGCSHASSRVQSPARKKVDGEGMLYGGCSPWHISSLLLVRVGRRF